MQEKNTQDKKMIDIYVEIEATTDKAIMIGKDHDDKGIWLPLSQITDENGEKLKGMSTGDSLVILVPEWLAITKELI